MNNRVFTSVLIQLSYRRHEVSILADARCAQFTRVPYFTGSAILYGPRPYSIWGRNKYRPDNSSVWAAYALRKEKGYRDEFASYTHPREFYSVPIYLLNNGPRNAE